MISHTRLRHDLDSCKR